MEDSSESCDELAQLISYANILEKNDNKHPSRNNTVGEDESEVHDTLSPFTKTYGSPKPGPDGLNYSDFDVPFDHLRILNTIEEWKEDYVPPNASMSSTSQTFDKICHAFVDDMHESEEDIHAEELESFSDLPVQSDYLDSLEFSVPQCIDESETEPSPSPMDTASDIEVFSIPNGPPLAESTQMTQSNHSQDDNSLSCKISIRRKKRQTVKVKNNERGRTSKKNSVDKIDSSQSVTFLDPPNEISSQELTKYVTIDLSNDLDHSQSLQENHALRKPSEHDDDDDDVVVQENCSLQSSEHSLFSLLPIKTDAAINSRTKSTNRRLIKTEIQSCSDSEHSAHHGNPHNVSGNHDTGGKRKRKLERNGCASKQGSQQNKVTDMPSSGEHSADKTVVCKVSDTPSSGDTSKIVLVSPENKDIPTPVHSLTSYQQVNPDAADTTEQVEIQGKLLRVQVNLDWMKQYYQTLCKE